MPSCSSNAKSKKKTKSKPKPRYQITPQSFQKLHPVHYQILEVLKEEIPVTFIQTCRCLYDELIPKIYERIEINENTYDGITQGVYIDTESGSEQDDDDEDEDEDLADDQTSSGAGTDSSTLPTPGLKNEALTHTRFINFTDAQGAISFVKDCSYCYDWYCILCSKDYTLQGQILSNVEHVHLEGNLVCLLAELKLESHPPFRECWETHRLDEFLDLISEYMTPRILCLNWPEDWSSEGWSYNPDDEEDEDDDWAIKRGMSELLLDISRTLHSLKHIVLNICVEQLHLVHFDMEELTVISDHKFTFCISQKPKTKPAEVIQALWDHFKSLRDYHSTFEYCLPSSKSYRRPIRKLRNKIL
ncbi:hypothetical protein I203_105470 [Kwoniella mangroviensis CBS 8507]|uniref:uncharacterized protein n=1 Tax=Kwoniella mangroviensis CBS 8507 TaxID=1296122 RepID=UPI00080D3D70|nr:uncharacterized protein I203_01281 [Kwoniella mangroviensis CBS 8507]OCF69424.1 hypothetical protein I203_01281 [Kwoniella mangroviensis CBS 8507]